MEIINKFERIKQNPSSGHSKHIVQKRESVLRWPSGMLHFTGMSHKGTLYLHKDRNHSLWYKQRSQELLARSNCTIIIRLLFYEFYCFLIQI